MYKKKNWIKGAVKKPGQLHRDLGVAPDKPIPADAVKKASKGNSKTAYRARFALTMAKMRAKRKMSKNKK